MIIGSIEFCSGYEVGGWLYSPKVELSGETVLAFLDGVCVGSGEISLHRQDLADAGLGNGRLGFTFPITLPDMDDAGRVVVTLTGCEAIIMQKGASVRSAETARPPALPDSARIDWMQQRGLLSASGADAIRALLTYGVAHYVVDPEELSAALLPLFEAIQVGPAAMEHIDLLSEDDFDTTLLEQEAGANAPVFALQCPRRTTFMVLETAVGDKHPARAAKDRIGTVDYFTDERTLLLIRRDVPFAIKPVLNKETIRCYYPVAPELQAGA